MEQTSFRLVFGDSPVVKVIDFFIDNQEFDYSLTDIANGAGIAWSTLHEFWSDFVKVGLVVNTRKIGRAELYKLNVANPLVKKLIEIDMLVSKQMVEEKVEKVIA